MEANRQFWSDQQQELRRALMQSDQHLRAIALFLQQHAMLHSRGLAPGTRWSFADEVLEGLTDEQLRRVPRAGQHSIAWLIWHIARTEDVTMNVLLAERAQVWEVGKWAARLKVQVRDIGTAMPDDGVSRLSRSINLSALFEYRLAVGRQTRESVRRVQPDELGHVVGAERVRRVLEQAGLVEEAYGVGDYWSRHTKANLLLIPATRHNFTHLNEARRVREKSRDD